MYRVRLPDLSDKAKPRESPKGLALLFPLKWLAENHLVGE
jgi:hypothetical protein